MVRFTHIKELGITTLNSFSDVFFIRNMYAGLGILLLCIINYNATISGILCIFSAYLTALFIGYKVEFLKTGLYTYNALLVGMAIGFLFKISLLSLPLIIIAGSATMFLTIAISHIFYALFGLQILSIPFVILSTLIFLSSGLFSNLFINNLYQPHSLLAFEALDDFLPFWLSHFFKAMGTILFMPNVVSGMIICLLLLLSSRILILLAFIGFLLGASLHGLFIGSFEQATAEFSSFNYPLIAMAVGAIFNIPNPKSYLLAMIGVAISTLVISATNVFWSYYGVPVFTLPFLLVTLTFIYVLRVVEYPYRPLIIKDNPEKTLDHFLTSSKRFTQAICLQLPFNDQWSVYQGFDDKWTHQGEWKHAIDFIKVDALNKSYTQTGTRLNHYYCFSQPILSPVRGRVSTVINHLPDNPIGSVDTINNWGNAVLIYDIRGFYALICHFKQESIEVQEGAWVEVGTPLGLCGNSGYSPQPHIHLHIQLGEYIGGSTIPFQFSNFNQNLQYYFHGLPQVNQSVQKQSFSFLTDQMTTFILDDVIHFQVFKNNVKINEITYNVKMEVDSSFYLSRGEAKLYFAKINSGFFMLNLEGNDSYLEMIYMSLPSVPLTDQIGFNWQDELSNSIILNSWQSGIANFINAFLVDYIHSSGTYRFLNNNTIEGNVVNEFFSINTKTKAIFSDYGGIQEIQCNEYQLIRNRS